MLLVSCKSFARPSLFSLSICVEVGPTILYLENDMTLQVQAPLAIAEKHAFCISVDIEEIMSRSVKVNYGCVWMFKRKE